MTTEPVEKMYAHLKLEIWESVESLERRVDEKMTLHQNAQYIKFDITIFTESDLDSYGNLKILHYIVICENYPDGFLAGGQPYDTKEYFASFIKALICGYKFDPTCRENMIQRVQNKNGLFIKKMGNW